MLCRHKKKYTGGYKLDVYGKGIVKISYSNKIHIQQMSTQVQIIDYIHTHTPRADTNRIVVFGCMCVGYNYVNYDNNI